MKNKKRPEKSASPEQVSAAEALKKMKSFTERKEKFVAAVKKSEN